jgi:succinate dehydrogenase / fumarate reductase, iron-sulfur subunit
MSSNTWILKIYRGTKEKQYWEEFEFPLCLNTNVIAMLLEIQKNPINRRGEKVQPISWEDGCLEEVCGSCSMLINGRPRQACTAIIGTILQETKSSVITLAPMTKFPLIRDLVVCRDSMFKDLRRIQGWVETDGCYERGFGPKQSQIITEARYVLSSCMTCGCCVEACPQVNKRSKFIGPSAISQVRLFNSHPTSSMQKTNRLRVLMEEGGVSDCGNAQNCAAVCPKKIPLTESIALMGREVTRQAIRDIFNVDDS